MWGETFDFVPHAERKVGGPGESEQPVEAFETMGEIHEVSEDAIVSEFADDPYMKEIIGNFVVNLHKYCDDLNAAIGNDDREQLRCLGTISQACRWIRFPP